MRGLPGHRRELGTSADDATDDEQAATAIERLIIVAGFDPVMAGGLDDAGRLGLPDGGPAPVGQAEGDVLDVDQARAAVAATRGVD